MIKTAEQAQEAQAQLCLRSDGGVTRADPHTAFAGVAAAQALRAPKDEDDPDAELRRAREARMAQMKNEHTWRQQGHGSLRELANEREFVEAIGPHERAIVLLDDGRNP